MLRWQDELVAGRRQELNAERLPALPQREPKRALFDGDGTLIGSCPQGPEMVLWVRERRLS